MSTTEQNDGILGTETLWKMTGGFRMLLPWKSVYTSIRSATENDKISQHQALLSAHRHELEKTLNKDQQLALFFPLTGLFWFLQYFVQTFITHGETNIGIWGFLFIAAGISSFVTALLFNTKDYFANRRLNRVTEHDRERLDRKLRLGPTGIKSLDAIMGIGTFGIERRLQAGGMSEQDIEQLHQIAHSLSEAIKYQNRMKQEGNIVMSHAPSTQAGHIVARAASILGVDGKDNRNGIDAIENSHGADTFNLLGHVGISNATRAEAFR